MSNKKQSKDFVCRWCNGIFPRPAEGNVIRIDGRAHFVPVHNEAEPTAEPVADSVDPVELFDIDTIFPKVAA